MAPTAPATAYDRALAYARDLGAEHGRNAASWYFDGNTPQDAYAAVLRGLEDGDPAVLDTLPYADLSGEWADRLTGPMLVHDALVAGGIDHEDDDAMYRATLDWFSDICDAYEVAFSDAAQSAIETVARSMVESETELRAAYGGR
jgi:hypothetical protein